MKQHGVNKRSAFFAHKNKIRLVTPNRWHQLLGFFSGIAVEQSGSPILGLKSNIGHHSSNNWLFTAADCRLLPSNDGLSGSILDFCAIIEDRAQWLGKNQSKTPILDVLVRLWAIFDFCSTILDFWAIIEDCTQQLIISQAFLGSIWASFGLPCGYLEPRWKYLLKFTPYVRFRIFPKKMKGLRIFWKRWFLRITFFKK